MLDKLSRSPLLLAGLMLASAVIGGGIVSISHWLRPASASGGATDVRGYLLAHPEVIPEAMDRYRADQIAQVVDANRDAIFNPFPGAVGGNPKGTVPVVVYMDYACGYCRASLPVIDQLVAENADVKIIYRELPILSEQSRTAATWSLAAAEQGKFKAYHDRLFAAGQLSEASINAAIDAVGIDRIRGAAVVQSDPVDKQIAANLDVVDRLGGSGTPTWVIGDRVISGAIPYETMLEAVREARKKG